MLQETEEKQNIEATTATPVETLQQSSRSSPFLKCVDTQHSLESTQIDVIEEEDFVDIIGDEIIPNIRHSQSESTEQLEMKSYLQQVEKTPSEVVRKIKDEDYNPHQNKFKDYNLKPSGKISIKEEKPPQQTNIDNNSTLKNSNDNENQTSNISTKNENSPSLTESPRKITMLFGQPIYE
jgi:hypothetical protein